MTKFFLPLFFITFLHAAFAPVSKADFSVQDYNQQLPYWGTSWKGGGDSINGYYPSFYTGFAVRANDPSRMHLRLARGNQTRVTLILDEQTVNDYIFDLTKRYYFYQTATIATRLANLNIRGVAFPQLEYFNRVIESSNYGILAFTQEANNASAEAIYAKSLQTLKELNPGRVFDLRINLATEFLKWKSQMRAMLGDKDAYSFFSNNPADTIAAINSVLWGRINYTAAPSKDVLQKLAMVANLAKSDNNDEEFIMAALGLFKSITGEKYQIRFLNDNGVFEPAIQCESAANCTLNYPEFTSVYPTGSVKSFVSDQYGNRIANMATPGLWNFLSRSHHEVDNIRSESYYGWAPKLDYEEAGNGFHNPAVRFQGVSRSVKTTLGIPDNHGTLWAVLRGGVSHGCSRLPLGHIWEMRNIFPVENKIMTQVFYFGSNPRDFDLYDIDGNGTPEVIGVEYMISYDLQAASGLDSREGKDLEISKEDKLSFYNKLYGAKNVFVQNADRTFTFKNPTVSLPSYLDYKKTKVTSRLTMPGDYNLYEMAYERDKVQFYLPATTSGLNSSGAAPLSKRIVRLFGRVRGCAPTSNKETCGEAAFDAEAAKILKEIR